MTQARMKQLLQAANLLLNARRNHTTIADLPLELQPQSLEEAAIVHGIMAAAFGPIGGWKIGAGSPDAIIASVSAAISSSCMPRIVQAIASAATGASSIVPAT